MIGASPFSAFFCSAFGQPPDRLTEIAMQHLDDRGREGDVARLGSSTSFAVRPCATIISAMSPTTLEDGVTLTMSPNMSLAAR